MSGKLRILVIADVKGKSVPIYVFERAISHERPSGNFAYGKVSIGGVRYGMSLDTDKQIYQGFPGGAWEACMDLAYKSYVRECNKENLDAHDRHMWMIHGYPMDCLGTRLNWALGRVSVA